MTRPADSGKIVIDTRHLDLHKILVYILLTANLGGEFYPTDRKNWDELETKIEEINTNVNEQMRMMDRRVLQLEAQKLQTNQTTFLTDEN